MYYDEQALRVIANGVGRPVKIELTMKNLYRGRFARVCVEMDLSLPIIKYVLISDH